MDARPVMPDAISEETISQDFAPLPDSEARREAHASNKRWQLPVPRYLEEVYTWAYIAPLAHWLFDRQWIVSIILWFNDKRMMREVLDEITSGERVYMPASVYGPFCADLAKKASPGQMTLSDISTVQLRGQRKRRRRLGLKNQIIRRANAAAPIKGPYDSIISFMLLHEVPEDYKHAIVNRLLDEVDIGGKMIFVDYHKMRWWHPLWPIMAIVAWWLEPYTFTLWEQEIMDYATPERRDQFIWTKETSFGGLYQKVIAQRRPR